MPNQQAVNQLANTLADIYNDMLPEPTSDAMEAAMDEIRDKHQQIANRMAAAINTFVKKSTVTIDIPWPKIKQLLEQKLTPEIFMNKADMTWCNLRPTQVRRLRNDSIIELETYAGTMVVTVSKTNGIS